MLTTETCPLFLGSVRRHNHFLPSRKEMSHHRCLSASSSGNAACCQPSHPDTRCFLPSREEKKPGAQLRGVRGARPGALREDEGAFAPPALRGCAGERAGKRVRKSPAAIGNAAWMSFWKFSAPGSWAGAQREQAALLPGHPPRSGSVPQGAGSPPGCAPSPRARGTPSQPSPTREPAEPNRRPGLHLLLFLLHLHPAPPRFQSLLPGQLLGVKGRHGQEMQIPKLLRGTRAAAGTAGSPAGLPARWGWLPGQKRERKNPFK